MVIYIISDGKKGHLSQTRGLAHALAECAPSFRADCRTEVHELDVSRLSLLSKLIYRGGGTQLPAPNLILCAGHGTHIAALRAAHYHRCLCMVCMKPGLPLSLFDLCIVPQHDYAPGSAIPPNVFLTCGALNGIHPDTTTEKKETLLLIGGPGREFGWDEDHLITQLSTVARYSTGHMVLTTSRRTPPDFIHLLSPTCPNIRIEPVETTGPHWVAEHLACAKEVWVTQDSVSMVYEALSCAAPVGILEMPPRKNGKAPSRVARGLADLVRQQYVTTYTQWLSSHTLVAVPPLHEAERTARYILNHYPALLS